jgi:hypothetical protein
MIASSQLGLRGPEKIIGPSPTAREKAVLPDGEVLRALDSSDNGSKA